MIGGIVLAGGASRRFGGDKRLATLRDGTPLMDRSISNAARNLPDVLVALRAEDEELETSLRGAGVACLRAADSGLGMAHTMAAAFSAIPNRWDGAMVLLADMPFIRDATYRLLTDSMQHGLATGRTPIVVPTFDGTPGHPVSFARRWFAEIQALTGDEGARSVVKRRSAHVERVPVNDPGVLQDIDTRAALQNLPDR